MTNWTQRAERDIQKLDKLHEQLRGADAFLYRGKDGDAELKQVFTEALDTVSKIEEPPHLMLLTPLLEYAIILADGFAENREERGDKLSDLVVITQCSTATMKMELNERAVQFA